MPNQIELNTDDAYGGLGLESWMPAQASRVLLSETTDGASLSLLVTDDETVQRLNREYRGYDQSTDVLSFGLSERAKPATDDDETFDGFMLPPGSDTELGEVIIAYPTAARQAAEHGRETDFELAHLLIHGILHLLGYDHYEPEEEREMRAREDRLLSERLWALPRPG